MDDVIKCLAVEFHTLATDKYRTRPNTRIPTMPADDDWRISLNTILLTKWRDDYTGCVDVGEMER